MIKLVCFDMDGLLIDSERQMWSKNQAIAAKQFGYDFTMEFMVKTMGSGADGFKKMVYEEYGNDFPYVEYRKLLQKLNDEQVDTVGIPLKKGAIELLDYLRKENIAITLGSSSQRDYIEKVLKKAHVIDYFDYIVCGSDVVRTKPDPEIYNRVIEHMGVDSKQTLILEDAHSGIEAGLKANAKVIAVPDVAYVSEEDKEKVFAVCEDLNEVIDKIREENETAASV